MQPPFNKTNPPPSQQLCPPQPPKVTPRPPLTGEALEDIVEGATSSAKGPEAGAEREDEDGAQAGLVPRVQEGLGTQRGRSHFLDPSKQPQLEKKCLALWKPGLNPC